MQKQVSQNFIDEAIGNAYDIALDKWAKNDEKMNVFHGSCEQDNEPNYEHLKRHIEVWITRHPEEMAEFLAFKKDTKAGSFNEFGTTKSGLAGVRQVGGIPQGLFNIFSILSPNFLGAKEISIEGRKKRQREFFRNFPVFQTTEKL